ncbi:DUF4062 domain-containing protein [Devosia sp. J2-20]|uniref:DUF4062 domain-containing protein n=1 Tax=Devosia sp. J2-20 TaxID=3026161 RepID=UPI00249B87B9|nr:DUF4062 domain-containing protein [Devosia sp. J2-20]WDQ98422.1 DUF4062 domain-containing protein [Devosia sp. J2-20]
MAQKIFHVFVSSTYSDLTEERKKISEAIAKAGYVPEGMELFPASSQKQFEFIKRVIDRRDYYVVVIGGRYGSLADDSVSYTEKEYEYAQKKGIPALAFLHKHPDAISASKTDSSNPDHVAKLAAFRTKLSASAMVDFWDNSADLATSVVIALGQEATLNPGLGWVRGDQAVDPKIFEDLASARARVEYLQTQLANSVSEEVNFPRNIASIESEIEVEYSVDHFERQKEGEEYKAVSTEDGITTTSSWKEVFLLLQSYIHKKFNERRLAIELPEQLAISHGIDHLSDSFPAFNIYSLVSPTKEQFRHQFEALGLIYADYVVSTNSAGVDTSDYIWMLTEKGRRFVAQSLAEKSPY